MKPCIEDGCPNLAIPGSPRCRPHHRVRTGMYRVPGYVTASRWGICWICGEGGADTADHVRSIEMGGTNAPENLRPAHRSCNSSRKGG